jgi:hypothetical protein
VVSSSPPMDKVTQHIKSFSLSLFLTHSIFQVFSIYIFSVRHLSKRRGEETEQGFYPKMARSPKRFNKYNNGCH